MVRNTQNVMLKKLSGKKGRETGACQKYYKGYNIKTFNIEGIILFPITGIKTQPPKNFRDEICNYTQEGRLSIHHNLKNVDINIVKYLMKNPVENGSVEYNDNRISVYIAQNGKCRITGVSLLIGKMECHHVKPINRGGTDKYSNLIFITFNVHKLLHAKTEQLELINKFRGKLGYNHIIR